MRLLYIKGDNAHTIESVLVVINDGDSVPELLATLQRDRVIDDPYVENDYLIENTSYPPQDDPPIGQPFIG